MKKIRKQLVFVMLLAVMVFGSAICAKAAANMNLTFASATETTALVKWNAVSGTSKYVLLYWPYGTDVSTNSTKLELKPNVLSFNFQLPKDKAYSCAVASLSAKGDILAMSTDIPICAVPGKVTTVEAANWDPSGSGATFRVKTNPAPNTWSGLEYKFMTSKGKTVKSGTVTSFPFTVSGLTSKQIYKLSVREYVTCAGVKYYGAWYTKWIVPEPKLKALKLVSGSNIRVSWRKVKGATKYIVYGSTSSSGGYKKIKTVSKKKSSYTVSKVKGKRLKTYKNYFFKVVACKGKVKSTSNNYKGGYIYTTYS